ncbi:hypothetical protein CCB80_14075 [Armatimonadetes bacterium Uphvl-Ar1]|nr:hypothetical protein CCB80_14075 [Armatimonadetes bacterium Uphvl-Ar1]
MMIGKTLRATLVALLLGGLIPSAFATDLFVDVSQARSTDEYGVLAENAVRNYNNRMAILSRQRLDLEESNVTFSMPTRVILMQNGRALPVRSRSATRGPEANDITLQFESSGTRAFPADYRTQLENTFSAAKSAMNGVFGTPYMGGVVRVLNYDADIPARQAVSGGFYIPNGVNGPEIRFPVYLSATSAGVNFIHTLLLAYMGDRQYAFDAYSEGFVRAATMRVSRVPGAIPNSTASSVEQTLDSLYDNSRGYDWSNYPGLGAPTFIAPNLLTAPLPAGGSTGGIYLLRYKMAGTAWAKVLTQYPGFIPLFNQYYQLNPAIYQTESGLLSLGQGILDILAGSSNATIEGLSFAEWAQRQSILDPSRGAGLKIVPEAFPFDATPASSDFGVFGVILNAFRTDSFGNETLLNGTSYPIYWRSDFSRFFTSAQDDVIPLNGGYGSVVPNFLADEGNNSIYRVAVDLPFQGKNVRLYLPAGAYSTGANPSPNNFYGTLVGFDANPSGLQIRLTYSGGSVVFPVIGRAFGGTITNPNFALEQQVTLEVRNSTNQQVLQTTLINKGRGDLAVDLRSAGSFSTYSANLLARMQGFSTPIEPYRTDPSTVTGIAPSALLFARWNPFNGRYILFPDEGESRQGLGYFMRPGANTSVSIRGRTSEATPMAVSLLPGWNLISVPGSTAVSPTDLLVTTTTQAISTWTQSINVTVGSTVFGFSPDPVNPDLGTLVPVTSLVPGQAYFMRALSNEGAVVIFGSSTRGRGIAGGQFRTESVAPTRNPWNRWFPAVTPWRNRLEFGSDRGHYSVIEIGQNSGASVGADAQDEPLPSGPGGFQSAIMNGSPLYRDIRPLQRMTPYTVKLVGLIPGQRYSVRSTALVGSTTFSINWSSGATNLVPGGTFWFTAPATEMTMSWLNR